MKIMFVLLQLKATKVYQFQSIYLYVVYTTIGFLAVTCRTIALTVTQRSLYNGFLTTYRYSKVTTAASGIRMYCLRICPTLITCSRLATRIVVGNT